MPNARPSIAAALLVALLTFVPGAGAEEIVPPGNSAASQYTEAFPTTGGERETEGRKQGKAVPADVLGARNSHRLESKGKEGKAVAEFTAETAPAPASETLEQSGDSSPGGSSSDQGGNAQAAGGGGTGGGGPTAGGGGGDSAGGGSGATTAQPSGSSGFGEVVGQMTGSSSGALGLWLPLLVIGAVVWSLVYLWRQRHRVA